MGETPAATERTQVVDVQPADEGLYRCMTLPGKILEIKHSYYAHLTVLNSPVKRPPRIIAGPASQTVARGSSVVLECLADGVPRPVVTWSRKDKRPISGAETGSSGNLVISKVLPQHEGEYVCTASSPDYKTVHQKSATLVVQVAPKLLQSLQSRRFPYKRDARFRCKVMGRPTPALRWLKDGQELHSGGRLKVHEDQESGLLIQRPELSDSGYYQCIANNSLGYVTSIARLSIYQSASSPDPPEGVQVRAISPTSLEVSWTPPSKHSNPVSWYVIIYKDMTDDGSSGDTDVVSNPGLTRHRVNNLRPYTNYSVHILALNAHGSSLASSSVYARTEQSVPLRTPDIISLDSPSPTSIRVTWEELPPQIAQGIITEYFIYYRHGNTLQDVTVSGDKQEVLLKYLQPDTVYHIRILAGTEAGLPGLSALKNWAWKEQRTAPLLSSSNLVMGVDAINSTAVLVTWEVLNDLFEVREFTLTVEKTVGSEKMGPYGLEPSDRSYILNDLDNGTWYEVTLEAFNGHGQYWTTIGSVHTKASPPPQEPEPPSELEGEVIKSRSIMVKWKRPQTEQKIDQYSISYMAADITKHVNTSSAKIITSETTSVVIHHLKPFTSYRVAVRSHVAESSSPFTDPIYVTTKEDVPSAPADVDWDLLSSTEIKITWQPPREANGVITSYTVLYSLYKDEPDHQWSVIRLNASDTSTLVKNLTRELYYFKVCASTVVGEGNVSEFIVHKHDNAIHHYDDGRMAADTARDHVTLDQPEKSLKNGGSSPGEEDSDLYLGIILGVTVGVLVIVVLIIVILLLRKRHHSSSQNMTGNRRQCSDDNAAIHQSSNGHPGMMLNHMESHEMSYCPILTTLPVNEHLDTKGGLLSDEPNRLQNSYAQRHVINSPTTDDQEKITEPLLSSYNQSTGVGEPVKETSFSCLGKETLNDIDCQGDPTLHPELREEASSLVPEPCPVQDRGHNTVVLPQGLPSSSDSHKNIESNRDKRASPGEMGSDEEGKKAGEGHSEVGPGGEDGEETVEKTAKNFRDSMPKLNFSPSDGPGIRPVKPRPELDLTSG